MLGCTSVKYGNVRQHKMIWGVDECVGLCEVGECNARCQATHTKIGAMNWECIGWVRYGNGRHDKVAWGGGEE